MAEKNKKSKKIKNNRKRFTYKMQIKLLAVFAFVLLALVYLLTRITKIATADGSDYARAVLSQENYDSQAIPYRRGNIQDRKGIILAKSDLVYNVIVDCKLINQKEAYLEPTVKALHDVFSLDEEKMTSLITGEETRNSQYRIVRKKVSVEEREAWYNNKSTDPELHLTDEEKAERNNIIGVWFEETYKRDYPYDSLASKVVGFSNDLDNGITGIESYYDDLLKGTNGRTFGYLNEDTEYQKTTIDPENGKNLVLTLDMNIQEIVEKAIAGFDETYGTDESKHKGAANVGVIVMDPNSGEVLAMADNHGYNLNKPRDLTDTYTNSEIKKLKKEKNQDKYVEILNARWANFCVSESFEPGSVFKPITIASALEVGAVHDGDGFYCDGGEFVTDTQINCDNIYGHGEETLEYAIVNSCNDALMQISMKLKISNFLEYQRNFGYGVPTGIDLPNENAGVTYNRSNMHEVELATNAFGQGFTCSMIQEAAAFSTVINGGAYYQPHVLKQVLNDDGTVVKTVEPLELKQLISGSTSAYLRKYLTTAVQKGTGRKSQVPGYLTGGKTGTAEKIDLSTGQRDKGKYLVSFIGACPMDDPQVVIYVIVDEPNVPDQADSSYAQILFRQIATEVFPYMGLYPTEEVTSELLSFLGLTQADVVSGSNRKTASFQAFDMYGNLYNDAYVNGKNEIVSGQTGQVLEGAYVNEDGNVVDGYGNVIETQINVGFKSSEQTNEAGEANGNDNNGSQIAVENPNMSTPPDSAGEQTDEDTVWAGVTSEDLEEDAEEEE